MSPIKNREKRNKYFREYRKRRKALFDEAMQALKEKMAKEGETSGNKK